MDNLYNNICRTCLTENGTMKPIFGVNASDTEQLVNKILLSCTWIKVEVGDGLPEQICLQCLQEINRVYTFKEQCEKSETYLRRCLNVLLPDKTNLDLKENKSLVIQEVSNINVEDDLSNLDGQAYFNDEDYFVDSQSSVDNRDVNQGKGGLINNYIQHLNVQKSESFNCDICQKLFKSKILLEKHRSKHKRSESGKLPERKQSTTPTKTCGVKQADLPRTCNICSKTFRFHSNLERHKLIHTGEKPYLCNVCGKGFAQLSYLKIHSYIHSGEKPYKCQMCEKSFSAPGTLLTHVRTHTGERPHVCKICGRDFPQSGYLTTHLRTHTGERPVECKVCHKRFSQSGRLIVHMRIHSGEKPYPCNQCGKSFAVKGTLKKHLRTHTGEKPYVCSTCGQAFAQSGTLAIHTKVHKK